MSARDGGQRLETIWLQAGTSTIPRSAGTHGGALSPTLQTVFVAPAWGPGVDVR